MSNLLDWQEIEKVLFEKGKEAILRFATEYPHEVCAFFAYAWTLVDGDFAICFDSQRNSLRVAQVKEQDAIEERKRMLQGAQSWKHAHYFLTSIPIVDHASELDLFAYPCYENIWFDGWEGFLINQTLPTGQKMEDMYLEGNVQLVLWRVLERLIEEGIFSSLSLASPFRLGYQFHDQPLVVLRMLNWPSAL